MSEFTIISNNCWGAEVYKELNLPYNTPFVGLFMPPQSFIEMLGDLPFFLSRPLRFKEISDFEIYNTNRRQQNINYPIAELAPGIEIHFLHYQSVGEAEEKWIRRLKRMNMEKSSLFIKFCDREVEDFSLIEKFSSLPYQNKVCFTVKDPKKLEHVIQIIEHYRLKEVIDGKSLYEVSKSYFDVLNWIKTGNGNLSLTKKIKLYTRLIEKFVKNAYQKLSRSA